MYQLEISINKKEEALKIAKKVEKMYLGGLSMEKALREAVRQYKSSHRANNK